ncbi:MAG: class I SAM-dependent methyltransferase [Gammaproteobacteria bacterium]|nr:class I SAM-dependent methyltransferase [Gammaproteobacteria bacterium]
MTVNADLRFVPETRFGTWFLKTETWRVHVLQRAMNDLERLLPAPRPAFKRILDIGTGHGYSLTELARRFLPEEIIALDPDPTMPGRAAERIAACPAPVRVLPCHAEAMDLADASVDLVFCHQSFHHIVEQEKAMAEFYRVLKPGGWLLFAESTRAYIHSWLIRYLFAHPMEVQKSAEEYLGMAARTGFEVDPARCSFPYLWWSRSDLGLLEWLGFTLPPQGQREETLVNAALRKPGTLR